MDSFDLLPLCAIINSQYFIAHGGISPELTKIHQINFLERFMEPPDSGIIWF